MFSSLKHTHTYVNTETHTHTHPSFISSPCSLKAKYAWFQKEGEKEVKEELAANCQLEDSGWVTV